MIQYVLFDLDGTLTDSKPGIIGSLRYAIEKMGRPVPDEETLSRFIGPPLQECFMAYCGYTAAEAAEGIELFRERYVPIGKFENAAAPGLVALCEELKERGYVLALSSSKPEALCVEICDHFGYTPSLTAITGSPPEGDWSKADVIRETFRRLGLTEADRPRVLMVGDRKHDVEGARACGIDCVGVEFFGYAETGELAAAGAAAVVSTAEALRAYILTH